MPAFVAISEARANLPDLVKQVSEGAERVTITSHGQPKAVLMNYAELENLQEELESAIETAEILALNPNIVQEIKQSEKEIAEGKFVRFEDLE